MLSPHRHKTCQQMDMWSSFLCKDKHSMPLQSPEVHFLVQLLLTIQEYGYRYGRFSWYIGQSLLDHLCMVGFQ